MYLVHLLSYGVVLKLILRHVKTGARRVGILVTLVHVVLMDRIILVLLSPTAVHGSGASIHTSDIHSRGGGHTTLVQSTRSYVHTTSVTLPVGLTTPFIGSETVSHEFFDGVRCAVSAFLTNLRGGCIHVSVGKRMNIGCREIVVGKLFHVSILLVARGILCEGASGNDAFSTGETQCIITLTSHGPVGEALRLFMLATGNHTGHTLRSAELFGTTAW